MPLKAVFYITGHGYGHAVRALCTMQALQQKAPDLFLYIRTLAPEKLFEGQLPGPFRVDRVQVDTGSAERDILFTDERATVENLLRFHRNEARILDEETSFIRHEKINAVLSDVPPMASEIAARAGVPSFAFANFTWDQIFAPYPGTEEIVGRIRAWYAKTTLGFAIPPGPEITAFPRCEKIPIITRRATADRDTSRRELGLSDDTLAVLVALKGAETGGRPITVNDGGMTLLAVGPLEGENVRPVDASWNTRFPDLVAACDVVLSKPGYGIVTECIANRRPLVHLPRNNFAETEPMMTQAEQWLAHRTIGLDDLTNGSLGAILREAAETPFPWPDVRVDGADVAAARILGELV